MSLRKEQTNPLAALDLSRYDLLPNTAGAKTAEEAVRLARLARASGMCDMVKVEVIGCDKTLLPDPIETLRAAEELIKDGFIVLPYTSDAFTARPSARGTGLSRDHAGSVTDRFGQGILNPLALSFIIGADDGPGHRRRGDRFTG